jgi:hypothetical protein
LCLQDTVVVVSPYPYSIEEDRHDVPLEDCWYARPQLFFNCTLRPKDGRQPKNTTYICGPDDLSFNLVFFNTFGELILPFKWPMEDAGVIKLYEPSPTPCLYVAPAENTVGMVPLIPLFWLVTQLQRSLTSSASARIQASRSGALMQQQQMESGAAMSMRLTPGYGSLGAASPAWVVLTVEDTIERKKAARDERIKRGWETRRHRKADKT